LAHSQPGIFNISLYDSSRPILYAGIDNWIRLKNIDLTKGRVSITNGMLVMKTSTKVIIARTNAVGEKVIITFTKNNIPVLKKEFSVDSIPAVKARLGYINDTIATLSQILVNPYLTVTCNCYAKLNIQILSFKLELDTSQDDEDVGQGIGNKMTEGQIARIRQLTRGDKLIFTDIKAVSADGRTRRLQDFKIIIK
jgi:hypothetical protein